MARSETSLEKDKSAIRGILMMGCDRDASAHAVGWTEDDLREEIKRDPEFAHDLAKAEGQAELHYMKLVHSATKKDEKNWRAAAWWLSQRRKERQARAAAKGLTTTEIRQFLESLADLLFNEITMETDRDKLVASLLTVANSSDPENVANLVKGTGTNLGDIHAQET
jgi:hypothetical protein